MNRSKLHTLGPLTVILFLLILSGGCKKKAPVAPPPPPPPPPPAAKPTATISAEPSTIEKGRSSTLTWNSTNATNVSIDQGLGDVSTSGSRSVSPSESTTYRITARGEGGEATASTRITVTTPPPPPPPPPVTKGPSIEELFSQKVKDVYFDYDKSDIRDDAKPTLAEAAAFFKEHGSLKFTIEGHCDERGSEEYNLGLGDRRGNAVKSYLVSLGISEDRINAVSFGKERPQCHDSNEECWQKNRRGHFVMTGR